MPFRLASKSMTLDDLKPSK